MLSNTARILPKWSILIPGLSAPLAWGVNLGWIPDQFPLVLLIAAVLWAFIDSVFANEAELKTGVARIGTRLIMVMYPGWLLWWVARLTWFDDAGVVILIFMLTVYLNDSLAWFFGMLLGRHRNIIAVSPNKSIEGFLGGTVSSVAVILISARFRPDILPHPVWQLVLFGIVAAFTTAAGDLVESAIKRSVGVKDSGRVIPGRGGMLDSIDSVLLTAPVFVLFLQMAV
jgi:phosphatidate cytidylyltransferase